MCFKMVLGGDGGKENGSAEVSREVIWAESLGGEANNM